MEQRGRRRQRAVPSSGEVLVIVLCVVLLSALVGWSLLSWLQHAT